MEPQKEPIFLPITYVKKTDSRKGGLASAAQLQQVERHVQRCLAKMTDEMYSGRLRPEPYWRGENDNACRYCEYKQVCHIDSGEVPLRKRKAISAEEFWNELTKEEAHG